MTHAAAADVQQGVVYGFEHDHVNRHAEPAMMSREEVVEFVLAAARFMRIRAPQVIFKASYQMPCFARISDWSVNIRDWGRNRSVLLHEVAHLGTWEDLPGGRHEMQRGQAHGPHFVRNAIELYVAFLNLRRDALEQGAAEFGLVVAPRRLLQAPSTVPFFDEEI